MKVAENVKDLRAALKKARGKSIGFVPTMGDLHAGHLSLLRRSKKENKATVLSIFVNPIQFNNKEDFDKYHRDEKADLAKAKKAGVDVVFLPAAAEFYPEGFQTKVRLDELTKNLCGPFRPGHFEGVATVVLKLFNAVQPTRAYFGLKDYQQYRVVDQMCKDLNLELEIVPCPTLRETDGLALSSRNRRLSLLERVRAISIHAALLSTVQLVQKSLYLDAAALERHFKSQLILEQDDKVEYIQAVDADTLEILEEVKPPYVLACAVWIGKTRLIDNILVGGA